MNIHEIIFTEGYWVIANEDIEFTYNPPVASDNLTRQVKYRKALPEAYTYAQSMNQAFYFVNDAEINGEPLSTDDLIIAYNDDVIVGARYWYGEVTDVPAMGADSDVNYSGYSVSGDKITFKVLDTSYNKSLVFNIGIKQHIYPSIISPLSRTLYFSMSYKKF